MTKLTLALTTSMLLLGMAPVALAAENAPDCESTQPWIGYTTTTSVQSFYENDLGAPGGLYVCEGEHWDGQDTVAPGSGNSCGTYADSVSPSSIAVGNCMYADAKPRADALNAQPLGFRVSSDGSQQYLGVDIALVGQAVLYHGNGMVGVYLRDNTPVNGLATVVSAPGITKGYVSENDCDQATYQQGAMTNDRTLCGRDNTAITVMGLP